MKTGRNDPCPCGSGKKYKKCCEAADQAKQQSEQAEEQAEREEQPQAQATADKPAPPPPPRTAPTANQSPHLRRGMLPRRGRG